MIWLSIQGTHLLLVTQGKALIRDRALIQDRVHLSFSRNNQTFNMVFIKKDTKTKIVAATNRWGMLT